MSSTSQDVCELWSGEGVVRVMGRPVLLQMVCVEDSSGSHIYTLKEAIEKGYYMNTNRSNDFHPEPKESGFGENPPNLSLNVNMIPLSRWMLVLMITAGLVLQGGVLAFAATSQYVLQLSNEDDGSINVYGFPIFTAGTVILALSMYLCAHIIESSTDEETWVPKTPAAIKTVIWLQQGGQTVGDQRFECFARCITDSRGIITSRKSKRKDRTRLVYFSVISTLFGFVAQFVGLRAMHPAVTLVQLVAVMTMTAIRSCAHIKRDSKNDIGNPGKVEGHELDWLALHIHGCVAWKVGSTPLLGISHGPWDTNSIPSSVGRGDINSELATAVMHTRARLAELSVDWNLELRDTVKSLQRTLNLSMDEIFMSKILLVPWWNKASFTFSLPVEFTILGDHSRKSSIELTMSRERDQNEKWMSWATDVSQLEAVMSLWVSSLGKRKKQPGFESIIYLGPATPEALLDYQIWIHRQTTPTISTLDLTSTELYSCFGYIDPYTLNDTFQHMYISSKAAVVNLCAQEIYAAFVSALPFELLYMSGKTERRSCANDADVRFRINNSKMTSLARIFSESGLGTIEEAYFYIFPALKRARRVPPLKAAFLNEQDYANSYELNGGGNWTQAVKIDQWVCENTGVVNLEPKEEARLRSLSEQRLIRLRLYIERYKYDPESQDDKQELVDLLWERISTFNAPISNIMASCVVCLCKATTHGTTNYFYKCEPEAQFTLAISILKKVDLHQEDMLPVVLEFIHDAFKSGRESVAEDMAIWVWNEKIFATESTRKPYLSRAHFEVNQVLLTLRHQRRVFLTLEEVQKYLDNPQRKESREKAAIEAGDLDNPAITIDLQLLRPFRTILQAAAGAGRLDVVKLLLSLNGALINDAPKSSEGRTALQAAAGNGHVDVVEYLLNASPPADIHQPAARRSGRTALQAASERGHADIVDYLLKNGASVNEPHATHDEACNLYRRQLRVEVPEQSHGVIYTHPSSLSHAHQVGYSSVCYAIIKGHEAVLELLLKAGANLNTVSHGTALQFAASRGDTHIVKKLLIAGADADMDADMCGGRTPLQAAAEAGHLEIIQILLKHGASINASPASFHGRSALAAATGKGLFGIAKFLLTEGADVNQGPGIAFGATALQAAASGGFINIIDLLLTAGAEINAAPSLIGGKTALVCAMSAEYSGRILERLLPHGDINAIAPYGGRTILQAATEIGNSTVVKILLEKGADVNLPPAPGGGRTALAAAAEYGYLEIAVALLDAGADPNGGSVEDFGHAAIEEAAGAGLSHIIEMLIRDMEPTKKTGVLPLAAAAGGGHTEMVELLLSRGAELIIEKPISSQFSLKQAAIIEGINQRSQGYMFVNGERVVIEPPLEDRETRALSKIRFLLQDMLTDNAVSAIELARNGESTKIVHMLERDVGMLQSLDIYSKQITHSICGSRASTPERHSYRGGQLLEDLSFAVL
jgi:ankyrin repeat protein